MYLVPQCVLIEQCNIVSHCFIRLEIACVSPSTRYNFVEDEHANESSRYKLSLREKVALKRS